MNARGHLLILGVLLIDFQIVFCNEFVQRKNPLSWPNVHDEISGGDFFKFWRNSKQRRSVKSIIDGRFKTADEQAPQISPHFECGNRVLKVFLKQADVVNLRILGPRGDLLHLSQLAAFCGVSIRTTGSDVHLLFSHESCYVKQEESEYVLTLSWYGAQHVLSCPVSVTPPSVVCENNSMKITIVADGTADELSIAFNGEWAPLLYVATECWHQEQSKQGSLTFSVPYSSCGVNFRDGLFILDLKSKGKMIPLSCPYKPMAVFPVKDPVLSETTQQLPQNQPNVYHKPRTVFPSQIVEQEQSLPVVKEERILSRSRSSSSRGRWLPKLPSLPGSFNLAVNFPFSLPIPKHPVPLRHPLTNKRVPLPPPPTAPLTPPHYAPPTPPPDAPQTAPPTAPPTPPPDAPLNNPANEPAIALPTAPPTPPPTAPPTPPPDAPLNNPANEPAIALPTAPPTTPPYDLLNDLATAPPTAPPTAPLNFDLYGALPAPVSSSNQDITEELTAQITKAPKFQHHYMQYPYRFQKPAASPQSEPKYQFSRVPIPSPSLYQPSGFAQNYNFPRPNPLQENPSLASLAQFLPPGYFICSHNQQTQLLPEMFRPPVQNPAQPLQYQKPEISQPAPAVPPMNGYSQQQLTNVAASSPDDSDTQLFQPTQNFQTSQHHPYFYQSNYGQQGSTTSPLSPASPLIPINLQSQTSRYHSYPALQDPRPFYPEYYQKPSGSVQLPWSTSRLPVAGLSQESKTMVQASSHTPKYLKYQTGGDQSLDLYQSPVVLTSGRRVSSNLQYQPSQLSTFPRAPLKPEVLSADVSTENTRSSHKGFFQPRSIAPKFTGKNPMSLPQPMPRFFSVKESAPVAQLPYRQGPLVRGIQNPHVHSERPSEPRSQTPQNDTITPYQFYRQV